MVWRHIRGYFCTPERGEYGIMYASEKNKRLRSRHLFFRRDNERTACASRQEGAQRRFVSSSAGGLYQPSCHHFVVHYTKAKLERVNKYEIFAYSGPSYREENF